MARLWLHIGAPKSATTTLQRFLTNNRDRLSAKGLTYISPQGRTSSNPVAVAINRTRTAEIAALSADLGRQINSAGGDCIISSEMFFGIPPGALKQVLTDMAPETTQVIVYLRRQDIYLEAKYMQKVKNGRFAGSIHDYIKKFDGSGADYMSVLSPWMDEGYTVRARILEDSKLVGGSVISDLMAVCGLDQLPDEAVDQEAANRSPSLERLQLLQVLKTLGVKKINRIQRSLPQSSGPKARFFTAEERTQILEQYAACNAALHKQFFAHLDDVFEASDLDEPNAPENQAFSQAQLAEIETVLRAVLKSSGAQ